MEADVRLYPDLAALSLGAARAALQVIGDAVRATGRCSVALSGGNTPQTFFRLMASQFRADVPWAHLHVFWCDERYVPPADPRSNVRMAREMLLDRVPCPAANIHPMPTYHPDPNDAATEYETILRRHFGSGPPQFDLMLLGIGPDGHTASLFPGSPALAERTRWVVAVSAPAEPPTRVTLTFPVLNEAANAYFLVAGSAKAPTVRSILDHTADPAVHPAAGVRLRSGQLTWWLDRDAAGLIEPHLLQRIESEDGD